MQKYYKTSRIAAIFIVMGLILSLYLMTLYKLQLFDTGADASAAYLSQDVTRKKVTLTANRGAILDRNGVKLVSTRAAYNVTISHATLKDREDFNQIILDLIHTAVDNGVPYTDTFPVTAGAPFSYILDMTKNQKKYLDMYLKNRNYFDVGPEISASELIVKMKEHYGIDYTMNITDARLIIGVRYELELRALFGINPYIFASDVSVDFITLLEEKNLPGVNIETAAKRQYHTTYAAHLLGYIGGMSQEEYDTKYKALGYSYNALAGQAGAEYAFESYLHGTDGEQVITTGEDGTVLNVETTKEPAPGNNVFLSIDIGLQEVCEDSLAATIDLINADRLDNERVPSGAVVVTDVNTGEVLASVSYPTYDPSTISTDFADLMKNPTHPLYNNATMGIYNPGSTFKMVTALAGLRSGTITPETKVFDSGKFTKYSDREFVCWLYSLAGVGHGDETVVTALRDSCNVFFYTVADMLPSERTLPETAADFGLGSKTGIELAERAGYLPTRENKERLLGIRNWYTGDTIQAAIGQSINYYTPMQLAKYTATIASGGVKYPLTLLSNIRSSDFSTIIYQPEHRSEGTVKGSEYIKYLQQGMRLVAKDGTAAKVFKDYFVPVACKTGTTQHANTGGNAKLNNGVFVCYAPADKPEIAIAVVVEKGESGATIMEVAKNIMDYYFREKPEAVVMQDNAMMP